jgi:hypothetical protein
MVTSPEDGGSIFLRNVGIYLQVYTALQLKRPTSKPVRLHGATNHILNCHRRENLKSHTLVTALQSRYQ